MAASLRPVASLHPAFTQAAISAAGVSTTLQGAIGMTGQEFQQAADLKGRFSVVTDELKAMLRGMQAGDVVRGHRLGLIALQTYNMSRQLVRKPEHADLLPHVEAMTRMRKLGKRAVTAPQPTPQPQPVPTTGSHPLPAAFAGPEEQPLEEVKPE